MAHLTHKIDWSVIVDYYQPFKDHGISLPIGECGRIHLIDKKTEIKVQNRVFLQDQVCTDKECKTTGSKVFRKNNRRINGFIDRPSSGEDVKERFTKNLVDVLREFALTELKSEKTIGVYQPEEFGYAYLSGCKPCDNFVTLLEFGDKKKLFEYSNSELESILSCLHGGQAVGNNMSFLFHRVLLVYINTNMILHTNAEPDKWPSMMKPESYFWTCLFEACDGQTFLPHCRKYLSTYMKDVNETRELCKRLFKFMYFFVMVHEKLGREWEYKIWF